MDVIDLGLESIMKGVHIGMGCKFKNILLTSILAVAGIFGVSSAIINIVSSGMESTRKVNAAENENLPATNFWVTDYVNSGLKYSIDSGDMHMRLNNVKFDSTSGYTHVNQLSHDDFPYVGDYVSGGNDGVLICKMGYDSEHKAEGWKKWRIVIPWFITEFNAEFYAHNENYLHYQGGDSVVDIKCWRGDDRWMNIKRDGWSYQDNSDDQYKKFYAYIDNDRTSTTCTYSQPKYDVTYHTNGGTSIAADVFKRSVKINQTTPEKDGYVFAGWYTDDSTFKKAFSKDSPVKSDLDLYAKWEEQVIVFWYTPNDGDRSNYYKAYSWEYGVPGSHVSEWPGEDKSGSVFKSVTNGKYYKWVITSWPEGRPNMVIFNNKVGDSGGQTGDLELSYSNGLWYYNLVDQTWHTFELNITYKDVGNTDFSGVHGNSYPTTHYYGGTTALDTPTKSGYRFDGWNTAPDGLGDTWTELPNNSTADITLYAKWTSGETAAQTFASGFNTTIGGVCRADGSTTFSSLLTAWNNTNGTAKSSQEYKYDHLDEYIQYWVLNNPNDNAAIATFIGKYDYILTKYGYDEDNSHLHDFLSRTPVPKGAIRDFSPLSLFGDSEDNLSTVIIIAASSVALLSVTALSILVIKKRKNKEE